MSEPKVKAPILFPVLLASTFGCCASALGGTIHSVPLEPAELRTQMDALTSVHALPPVTLEGEEPVAGEQWTHDVALAPNECVALVVAARGAPFTLHEARGTGGVSAGVQVASACAGRARTTVRFVAEFDTGGPGSERDPVGVLFEERRAATDDQFNLFTLPGVSVPPEIWESRWRSELTRRAERAREAGTSDGALLGDPVRLEENAALVHPLDAPTLHAVEQAAWLGFDEREAIEFQVQGLAGERREGFTPVTRIDGTLRRLLVALDARGMDACVVVEIWPEQGTDLQLQRLDYPSGDVSSEGNVSRVCPQHGVSLFSIARASSPRHRVVLRHGEPARAVGRSDVPMPSTSTFRANATRCDAGDAAACVATASALRAGHGIAPDVARAADLAGHACTLDAGTCWEVAGTLQGPAREDALRRACLEGGSGPACAVIGDDHRRRPADHRLAYIAYRQACTLGIACEKARNMVRLELAAAIPEDDLAAALDALR